MTGPVPAGPDPDTPRPETPRHGGDTDATSTGYGPDALATPANVVTVVRLLVAPILFAMIADTVATWPNFVLWTALASTDGIDGFIARRHGTTRSGAFLDPLADKVLVLGAMFALVAADTFPLVPVLVIAARELAVSLYRIHLARQGLAVPARRSAKVKTLVQALAVGAAVMPWLTSSAWIALTLLWAALAMSLVSGLQYLLDGRRAATSMQRP